MADKTLKDRRSFDNEQVEAPPAVGEPAVRATSAAVLKTPDGRGKKTSGCGDTIEIFIALDGDMIKDIGYNVDGCTKTLACARAAVSLARGKSVVEARRLTTWEQIDKMLGGLPEHNKHCAKLAAEAMDEALYEAVVGSREPWRKLYRKRY